MCRIQTVHYKCEICGRRTRNETYQTRPCRDPNCNSIRPQLLPEFRKMAGECPDLSCSGSSSGQSSSDLSDSTDSDSNESDSTESGSDPSESNTTYSNLSDGDESDSDETGSDETDDDEDDGAEYSDDASQIQPPVQAGQHQRDSMEDSVTIGASSEGTEIGDSVAADDDADNNTVSGAGGLQSTTTPEEELIEQGRRKRSRSPEDDGEDYRSAKRRSPRLINRAIGKREPCLPDIETEIGECGSRDERKSVERELNRMKIRNSCLNTFAWVWRQTESEERPLLEFPKGCIEDLWN